MLKTILGFLLTLISGTFIDLLVNSKDVNLLYKYCIIFGMVSILSIILNITNGYIGTKIQALAAYRMSKDIFEHMIEVPVSYTKNRDMTYFSQRVNTDCNAVTSFFIDTFISIFINILTFLISLLIIIKLDIRIAIILSILAVVYYIIYALFRKPMYKKILIHKENSSYFFSSFFECMNSITFIKNHSIVDTYRERLDHSFFKVLASLLSYQKIQLGLTGCDSIITTFATLIVYVIGGLSIILGKLTVGAFTIMLNLFNSMLNSVKFFLNFGKIYQETLVSYNRIREILDIPKVKNGNMVLDKIESIELKNVSFKYNDKLVIRNFNYTFKKGNIYFLIGGNGVGKSTLLNLIMGQYVNEFSGSILFNNIDMNQLDLYNLKKRLIGFSEQDTILVADTVLNNLCLLKNSYNDVGYYIEKLDFSSYVESLDYGLNSIINTQQNNISGGEKQKISIIRQFILNPDVLIFDEPTSALEVSSKIHLMELLKEVKEDKIIIIVTHDEMLYQEKDIIINLDLMNHGGSEL